LADYTTLKHLDLHCSNIDEDGTIVISGALTAITSSRFLRLWYARIGGKVALVRPLVCTTLEELSFGGGKVGDDGAVALADALATNTPLTVLDLSCTWIGEVGIRALGHALGQNNSLTKLAMQGNDLGTRMTSLANALQVNKGLVNLDLSSCFVDGEGATSLAEAPKTNTVLKILDSRLCIFEFKGAVALAESLKSNSTLATIRLSSCKARHEGAAALADAHHQHDADRARVGLLHDWRCRSSGSRLGAQKECSVVRNILELQFHQRRRRWQAPWKETRRWNGSPCAATKSVTWGLQ
jgi:NLR family CARD domain-containing protein 3